MATKVQTTEIRIWAERRAKESAEKYGIILPEGHQSVTVRGPKDSMTRENITKVVGAWSSWQMAKTRAADRFAKADHALLSQNLKRLFKSPESESKGSEEMHDAEELPPDVTKYDKACSDTDKFYKEYSAAMTKTGLKVLN